MIEDSANNVPSLTHILSPQTTNRSVNSIQIQPELIKISSRRKRKYLQPQKLSTEQIHQPVTDNEHSITDKTNIDNQQTYRSNDDNKSDSSQRSKSDSNKETKPGATLQVEEEEEFDKNDYLYELKQTRRMQLDDRMSMKVKIEEQEEQQEEQQRQSEQEESEQEFEEKQKISNQYQKYKKKLILNKKITNIGESIKEPITQGYRVTCVIEIEQSLVMSNKYYLYLNKPGQQKVKSIVSAKKQMLTITPSFIISTNQSNHSMRNGDSVGRLVANFSGTQWKLIGKQNNNQLLLGQYVSSFMGSKGLRELEAYKIDRKDPNYGKYSQIGLSGMISSSKRKGKLMKISTARPKLDNGKFKLDFRGLAKIPSSKNLILSYQKAGNEQKQCLLLAKQKDTSYIMQVGYPLSLLEGFSLCLTSLNGKLLVN